MLAELLRVSLKACVPYASVVKVFQTSEEFISFNEMLLAQKFGKVTWLCLSSESYGLILIKGFTIPLRQMLVTLKKLCLDCSGTSVIVTTVIFKFPKILSRDVLNQTSRSL